VATHLCNLGYGHAIQTAIKYAHQMNYDVLITLDADGQHYPEQVQRLCNESREVGWDLLIVRDTLRREITPARLLAEE